jgi:hypothetical protein
MSMRTKVVKSRLPGLTVSPLALPGIERREMRNTARRLRKRGLDER